MWPWRLRLVIRVASVVTVVTCWMIERWDSRVLRRVAGMGMWRSRLLLRCRTVMWGGGLYVGC